MLCSTNRVEFEVPRELQKRGPKGAQKSSFREKSKVQKLEVFCYLRNPKKRKSEKTGVKWEKQKCKNHALTANKIPLVHQCHVFHRCYVKHIIFHINTKQIPQFSWSTYWYPPHISQYSIFFIPWFGKIKFCICHVQGEFWKIKKNLFSQHRHVYCVFI